MKGFSSFMLALVITLEIVPGTTYSICPGVNIVTRAQWGAMKPKSVTPLKTPVGYFFIHHTATPSCTNITSCSERVRGIQKYHMKNKGWADIGYSFLAGEDGNIYEGRGWKAVGAHTKGYNSRSLAVSFIGNYMQRIPNSKAISAARGLISCGVAQKYLTTDYDLLGHRDVGQTDCPGDALYKYIRTWPHYNKTVEYLRYKQLGDLLEKIFG